ncbi:MAG TPA: hypothetical protein VHE30_23755 [Polyangiaceae bacterium]|nr:hypothetical protein [Polyangiaceae bacterium]
MTAKKARMGRPPVPKKLEKRALLSVRFSDAERAELESAARRNRVSTSEWARGVLLDAARRSSDA